MKANFKPLGIAAAVAAVSAGYVGTSVADPTANNRGDLALVPYYTVENGFNSGIHIINTTAKTQVVKLRYRRGSDSMDSLDFNLIMSPKDEWVGSIQRDDDDRIFVQTADTTCTAPAATDGKFFMPDTGSNTTVVNFREGADEGYIEVIGMGQTVNELQPIAVSAKHASGVPKDCADVRRNFFRVSSVGDVTENGVHLPALTANGKPGTTCALVVGDPTTYPACGVSGFESTQAGALSVNYFSRDSDGGLEYGSNAVHIDNFNDCAMITNQEVIVAGATDPLGYLFPDLDGGSPGYACAGLAAGVDNRGFYDAQVRLDLGQTSIINDWSTNTSSSFEVTTDWVVTLPGQYTMTNIEAFIASLLSPLLPCKANVCDFRDLPVGLSITYYDREEGDFTPEEGDLVVSPAINVAPSGAQLLNEVNVIEWSNGSNEPVLGSNYAVSFQPALDNADQQSGWAELTVSPTALKNQSVWSFTAPGVADPNVPGAPIAVTNTAVPIIGMAVWQRNFGDNAAANYGRAVDHAYGS